MSPSSSAPVNERTIVYDGTGEFAGKAIPALDARWCSSDYRYPTYKSLTVRNKVSIMEWLQNTSDILDTCEWLLQLPYHKFWSQVLYGNPALHAMIDSYLALCPRHFDPELLDLTFFSRKHRVRNVSNELNKRIFFLFVRMATPKESSSLYMSTDFFADAILNHRLFDMARLVDFGVLYGRSNPLLVQRIIENIFKGQPKLHDQVDEFAKTVIKLFERCEHDVQRAVGRKVQLVCKTHGMIDDRIASDVALYLVDALNSLQGFGKFCPKLFDGLHAAGLTLKIPQLFEQTVNEIITSIMPSKGAPCPRPFLRDLLLRLEYVRAEFVVLFRKLLEHLFLNKTLSVKPTSSKEEKERAVQLVQEFLNIFVCALNYKSFLQLYSTKFPLTSDLNEWLNHGIDIDMDHVSYIQNAIDECPTDSISETMASLKETFPDEAKSEHVAEEPEIENVLAEENLVPLQESQKRGLSKAVEDKNTVKQLRPFYDQFAYETEEDERTALVGTKSLNAPLPPTDFFDDEDEYDDAYDQPDVVLKTDVTADELAVRKNDGRRDSGPRSNEGQEQSSRPFTGEYTGGKDRQDKDRRKAFEANHNRREMAKKKQAQGFGYH